MAYYSNGYDRSDEKSETGRSHRNCRSCRKKTCLKIVVKGFDLRNDQIDPLSATLRENVFDNVLFRIWNRAIFFCSAVREPTLCALLLLSWMVSTAQHQGVRANAVSSMYR